jgi:hypothetical protein
MEISIKLVTQEAKEIFACIKIFDNLHLLMDNLQNVHHEHKDKVEELYLFVNKVFIDYRNFVTTTVQMVVSECQKAAKAYNVATYTDVCDAEEVTINPNSSNITSDLISACKLSDNYFYYRKVVYFPPEVPNDLASKFDVVYYTQIGMAHIVWQEMGKIVSLLK